MDSMRESLQARKEVATLNKYSDFIFQFVVSLKCHNS